MPTNRKSLQQTFAELRGSGQIGLLPFVPAGYPNLDTTAAVLEALQSAGASAVEVGFPFSDPIADGPTIQEAFTFALARQLRVADVMATVRSVRDRLSVPLVAMVSFSIIYRHGVDRFAGEACRAGFDGLIVPDLPPPEADAVCQRMRAAGLDTVMLIAPTTPADRRRIIVELCSGFVYYLSVSGTTGARDRLPEDVVEQVKQIRAIGECPVCVGFGVSRPEHVRQLLGVADGAIVGSALVRQMKAQLSAPPSAIARGVAERCAELLSQVRQ